MDEGSVIVGALIVGVVCGLFPLVFGLTRGQTALAVGGFVACIAGGLVLGILLALPLAILFMVLIHTRSRGRPTTPEPPATSA